MHILKGLWKAGQGRMKTNPEKKGEGAKRGLKDATTPDSFRFG